MQIFRTETIEFGELTGDILIQNAFELIDRMMEEEKIFWELALLLSDR